MPARTATEWLEQIAQQGLGGGLHTQYRVLEFDLSTPRTDEEILPAGVTARALTILSAPAAFTFRINGGDPITAERGLAIDRFEIRSLTVSNTASGGVAQIWISW